MDGVSLPEMVAGRTSMLLSIPEGWVSFFGTNPQVVSHFLGEPRPLGSGFPTETRPQGCPPRLDEAKADPLKGLLQSPRLKLEWVANAAAFLERVPRLVSYVQLEHAVEECAQALGSVTNFRSEPCREVDRQSATFRSHFG